MRRYTTPTITLTISGIDLSACDVYVTFKQGSTLLTKSDTDVAVSYTDEVTTLGVYLSQEETAMFDSKSDMSVQANWITSAGVRQASRIRSIKVEGNLLQEVIEYGS